MTTWSRNPRHSLLAEKVTTAWIRKQNFLLKWKFPLRHSCNHTGNTRATLEVEKLWLKSIAPITTINIVCQEHATLCPTNPLPAPLTLADKTCVTKRECIGRKLATWVWPWSFLCLLSCVCGRMGFPGFCTLSSPCHSQSAKEMRRRISFSIFGCTHPVACGILVLQPGMELVPPPLEGRVLITGLPGKSQEGRSFIVIMSQTSTRTY